MDSLFAVEASDKASDEICVNNSSGYTLHDFQQKFADEIAAALAVQRSILAVLPTGGGKTVVGSDIIRRHELGGVLFVAHRSEIIDQTSDKLRCNGIAHGIIQAGKTKRLRPQAFTQVASIQTLFARRDSMTLPRANLVIIDEAHHSVARTYQWLVGAYPEAKILGLTATPCRSDGRGLGGIFERLVIGAQVQELIDQKRLVGSIIFTRAIDLSGISTIAGDFAKGELERRMDRDLLVGDVVEQWLKHGQNRQTICFASGVGHSRHITEQFIKAGVPAEHLDGQTPADERAAILERLRNGATRVVCNAMVLTEGFDAPVVGCISLVRPTKSFQLYRQMIGRALRTSEGKSNAIVIDHGCASVLHGRPEDAIDWTLDPDLKAQNREHRIRQSSHESALCECSQCGAQRLGGHACPNCGFLPQRRPEYRPHLDEDLVELGRQPIPTREEARAFHGELLSIAQERGRKAGWAWYSTKTKFEKYGIRVNWSNPPLREPSPATRAWVKSRDIAYAKSRGPRP